MNGIPAACDLPGDLEGNCCRARAESGIDFDEFETFSTPRYVGGFTQVGTFIQIILPYIFAVAGIVLLVSIMISGFQLLVSGGDPKSVQVAKSRLTNSLLGFAAVIFAYFVVQLVGFILGLDGFGGVFSN